MPKQAKEKTCKQRVGKHLKSRLSDLRALWEAEQTGNEDGVEGLGTFHEYGLSFDYVTPETFKDQDEGYFRYLISWGGPSDEFRFYTGPDFHPYRIEYVFMDWYDGATENLTGEDKKLLLEIFSRFHECGSVESVFNEATKE